MPGTMVVWYSDHHLVNSWVIRPMVLGIKIENHLNNKNVKACYLSVFAIQMLAPHFLNLLLCFQCDSSFGTANNLKIHVKIEHEDKINIPTFNLPAYPGFQLPVAPNLTGSTNWTNLPNTKKWICFEIFLLNFIKRIQVPLSNDNSVCGNANSVPVWNCLKKCGIELKTDLSIQLHCSLVANFSASKIFSKVFDETLSTLQLLRNRPLVAVKSKPPRS